MNKVLISSHFVYARKNKSALNVTFCKIELQQQIFNLKFNVGSIHYLSKEFGKFLLILYFINNK